MILKSRNIVICFSIHQAIVTNTSNSGQRLGNWTIIEHFKTIHSKIQHFPDTIQLTLKATIPMQPHHGTIKKGRKFSCHFPLHLDVRVESVAVLKDSVSAWITPPDAHNLPVDSGIFTERRENHWLWPIPSFKRDNYPARRHLAKRCNSIVIDKKLLDCLLSVQRLLRRISNKNPIEPCLNLRRIHGINAMDKLCAALLQPDEMSMLCVAQ
ncbi:hypothetical protein BRX37_04880 [Sphingomonas sp. S-NIH.Pt3_0716]|nr:hypothetical protein BRX37_04880 [Sphingomonas sp. S-NIH.Pt3_0716]